MRSNSAARLAATALNSARDTFPSWSRSVRANEASPHLPSPHLPSAAALMATALIASGWIAAAWPASSRPPARAMPMAPMRGRREAEVLLVETDMVMTPWDVHAGRAGWTPLEGDGMRCEEGWERAEADQAVRRPAAAARSGCCPSRGRHRLRRRVAGRQADGPG